MLNRLIYSFLSAFDYVFRWVSSNIGVHEILDNSQKEWRLFIIDIHKLTIDQHYSIFLTLLMITLSEIWLSTRMSIYELSARLNLKEKHCFGDYWSILYQQWAIWFIWTKFSLIFLFNEKTLPSSQADTKPLSNSHTLKSKTRILYSNFPTTLYYFTIQNKNQ